MENKTNIEMIPYVRYLIEGAINDKGIGYTVKKAVNTFLESHNYEGKVNLVDSNSNHFSCTLELYDNGKDDFNIRALKHHIDNSGKLPTKKSLRPEISIKPIPQNYSEGQQTNEVGIKENTKFNAYQKTIEELNSKISQRESSFQNLTNVFNERQKIINEQNKEIRNLEARLETARPKQYSNAREALFNSYVSGGLETLIELSEGITELDHASGRNYYEQKSGNVGTFIDYIKDQSGIEVNNEAELNKMAKRMGSFSSWEETPISKENKKAYEGFETNKKILEFAQTSGATPDIVQILSEKINANEKEIEMRKISEEVERNKFFKEKEMLNNLEVLRSNYRILENIRKSSKEREESGAVLPILAKINREEGQRISFSIPFIQENDPYQNYLMQITYSQLKNVSGVKISQKTEGDSFVWEASFSREVPLEDANKKIYKCIDSIKKDELTRALGVIPKISLLEEF